MDEQQAWDADDVRAAAERLQAIETTCDQIGEELARLNKAVANAKRRFKEAGWRRTTALRELRRALKLKVD